MLKMEVPKTPKMILNEICVKRKVVAKWDTRADGINAIPPAFTSVCHFLEPEQPINGKGKGGTKKEAEQNASIEVISNLMKMGKLDGGTIKDLGNYFGYAMSSLSVSGKIKIKEEPMEVDGLDNDSISDTDDNDLTGEPIGELTTICQKFNLSLPRFTDDHQRGKGNTNIFTVNCTVGNLSSQDARRRKKQDAKRMAAYRVVRDLRLKGFTLSGKGPQPALSISGSSDGNSSAKIVNPNFEDSAMKRSLAAVIEKLSVSRNSTLATPTFQQLKATASVSTGVLKKNSCFCSPSPPVTDETAENQETLQYFQEYHRTRGGALELFKKSAKEIKLNYQFETSGNLTDKLVCIFLVLIFPKDADLTPLINLKTHAVYGTGSDLEAAKQSAAMKALKLIREMLLGRPMTVQFPDDQKYPFRNTYNP